MGLKHKKTSGIPDGSDTSLVRPSDWNEEHEVDFNGLLKSDGGLIKEAVPGTDYLAPNGSGAALTGITKAQVGLGNVTNESKATMFASPVFTGTPIVPTAAADTQTTQAASTEFVISQASSSTPLAPAVTALAGTSKKYSRDDHVHPTNFTATATDIKANGTQSAGSLTTFPRADHVHPTDATRAPVASPTFTGTVTAPQFASTATTGTAPMSIASQTMVSNLNAEMLGGSTLSSITTPINDQLTSISKLSKDQSIGNRIDQVRYNSTRKRMESWDGDSWEVLDLTGTAASVNFDGGALGFRNKIYNGAFRLNSRGYVSGTALAAGSYANGTGYGHDSWRAGPGGCTYTFTGSNAAGRVVTITVGTLITKAFGNDINVTEMVVSWVGTAQCRIGKGSLLSTSEPSGSYANSPIIVTTTPGEYVGFEFNTGTLSRVQFENGNTPTAFEWVPYYELLRYGNMIVPMVSRNGTESHIGYATTDHEIIVNVPLGVIAWANGYGTFYGAASDYYINGIVCNAVPLIYINGQYATITASIGSASLVAGRCYLFKSNVKGLLLRGEL